jgi:hypothetical protein
MKNACISAVVLAMALSLQAQSSKFYVAILPGCQLNSSTAVVTSTDRGGNSYTYSTTTGRGFVGSVDGAYFFTDHFAIHAGYVYGAIKWNSGEVVGPILVSTNSVDGHFNLFEIGPEFDAPLSEHVLFYGQLNVGRTFGGSQTLRLPNWGPIYLPPDSQGWTMGAALGIRWVPGTHWGLAGQLGYHRINNLQFKDYWDARLGVVIRF